MLLRILIGESPFGCSIFRKKKKSKIFVKLSLMSLMCISLWFLLYLCLISFLDVKYICVAGQLSDLSKTLLQLKGYVFRWLTWLRERWFQRIIWTWSLILEAFNHSLHSSFPPHWTKGCWPVLQHRTGCGDTILRLVSQAYLFIYLFIIILEMSFPFYL